MLPATSARNLTPSSTALVSASVRSGVAVAGQMVHGQVEPPPPPAVVKLQMTSVASGVPAVSFTPVAPPFTVAVYVLLGANDALGVRVAVRVPAV